MQAHCRGQRRDLAAFIAGLDLDPSVLDACPHQLSGGMRQRVLAAIASHIEPQPILADEPTPALDVVVHMRIVLMLVRIQRRLYNTLVFVSQYLGVYCQIIERLIVMYEGEVAESGATRDIFATPPHAYPQDLISSLPKLGSRAPELRMARA